MFLGFYRDSRFAQGVKLFDQTPGILMHLGDGLPGGGITLAGKLVTSWYVTGLV
jgi:hypothetical protein